MPLEYISKQPKKVFRMVWFFFSLVFSLKTTISSLLISRKAPTEFIPLAPRRSLEKDHLLNAGKLIKDKQTLGNIPKRLI